MARSIEEILNQILEAKNAEPQLATLNSTSKISLYRLYAFVIATAIHFHERTWELFRKELEQIADEANVGTAKWLQRKALEYQHGSTLVVVNDTVRYNTVDASKRIISRCSVRENDSNRNVLVKVAKDNGNGGLTKLSESETNGLKSYLSQIKMAGTKVSVTTLDADRVSVFADVYYDASYTPETVKPKVKAAITNYMKEMDFSGNIYQSKIQDAIQAVEGVKDVVITDVKCRMSTDTLVNAVSVGRVYESYAGYVLPEETTGYSLEDTITMKVF